MIKNMSIILSEHFRLTEFTLTSSLKKHVFYN